MRPEVCPYCNEEPCSCPVLDVPSEDYEAPDDPICVDADELDDGEADL